MEWKRETKGWKQVEIPGFIQEGEAGGRRGKQRRRQPSKNRSKGNFSGKNGRPQGEDGKNRLQNREKWLWNREKTIFSIDNFAPCRLYCYLARFRPERRVF